ncbi:acetyl-coenzyme A synthetase, chloroplastic/glyoxysomal-like [Rosa sericea]
MLVAVYLPMLMELPITMLAFAYIGVVHSFYVCLTYDNESALKREVLIGNKDEIYGGRMAYLNIQLLVQWSGLMQRIHFLCSISVGALGSPSEFCTQLGIYGAAATTSKYAFDYKPSDIYWYPSQPEAYY